MWIFLATIGIFAEGFVRESLIVPGDAATTANNIMANELLFRIGFVSDLIHETLFLLLAWTFYVLLKPVNKNHALLMVLFAIVSVSIQSINLLIQFSAVELLSGASYLTDFPPDQLHAQVMFFLNLQNHGIVIAQIFSGLWALPLGFLVYKSGFLPKIFGVLLMIGAFGCQIDFFQYFLFPDYRSIISLVVLAPAVIGIFSLSLWLLFKGVDVEQWEKRALESA